jgi:hypothetical protein
MAVMKENTRRVLDYLKENQGADLTAADVAAALDLDPRSVNGSFTSFCKKGLGVREEAQVEKDGKYVDVKFLKLTDAGIAFDPDATEDAE